MSWILDKIKQGETLRQCKFSKQYYLGKIQLSTTSVNELLSGGKIQPQEESHWDTYFCQVPTGRENALL